MEKEVTINAHIYKNKEPKESAQDIENELLTILDDHGFSAQIYKVETREHQR